MAAVVAEAVAAVLLVQPPAAEFVVLVTVELEQTDLKLPQPEVVVAEIVQTDHLILELVPEPGQTDLQPPELAVELAELAVVGSIVVAESVEEPAVAPAVVVALAKPVGMDSPAQAAAAVPARQATALALLMR